MSDVVSAKPKRATWWDRMTAEERVAYNALRREKYAITGNTDAARARKRKTGFSQNDVDAALKIQDGKCAGCLVELSTVKIHADHCHVTGKKRGLLCAKCNLGLGHLQDSREILFRLAEYLKMPPMSALNKEQNG